MLFLTLGVDWAHDEGKRRGEMKEQRAVGADMPGGEGKKKKKRGKEWERERDTYRKPPANASHRQEVARRGRLTRRVNIIFRGQAKQEDYMSPVVGSHSREQKRKPQRCLQPLLRRTLSTVNITQRRLGILLKSVRSVHSVESMIARYHLWNTRGL